MIASGSDILDTIMLRKAEEVAVAKAETSLQQLKLQVVEGDDCRGFAAALAESLEQARPAVIAEVKKASPSKGIIREDFDPAYIAGAYQQAGASCLSVLTDTDFFGGSIEYFKAARAASSLPMLRKDFIFDPYQVYQARAMGADCILLIAAVLENDLMAELASLAQSLGMDVLVEVHDRGQLDLGLSLGLPMIGINNRNLRTFETSLATTVDLLSVIPDNIIVITESGIHSVADVALMQSHGVNSFLVGEAFMRAEDPGKRLSELFFSGHGQSPFSGVNQD